MSVRRFGRSTMKEMAVKLAKASKSPTKAQDDPRAVDEAFVRQLLAHAQQIDSSSRDPTRPADEDGQTDVLFDCEVDGVRCVLARARNGRADAVSLSPRESEIARMIAKGYPNKTIASVLEISVWTVSTHLRRIFAKLGVTSRTAMVTTMFKSRKL